MTFGEWQTVMALRPKLLEALRAELPEVVSISARPRSSTSCSFQADNEYPVPLPPAEEKEMYGFRHMHLPFARQDGSTLLLRVEMQPVRDGNKVNRINAKLSEMATMKALKSAGIPVPEVYGGLMNVDGHLAFAMEPMPGRAGGQYITGYAFPGMTYLDPAKIPNFVDDVADLYVKLSALQFPRSGFLQPDGSIGPFLGFVNVDDPEAIGRNPAQFMMPPADSFREKMQREIDHRLSLATEMIHIVSMIECETLLQDAGFDDLEPGIHYLMHYEDAGSQYLVDEEAHIKALIDWEWSFTASKGQAFSGPLALHTRSFQDGDNDLNLEEVQLCDKFASLGRSDLADCVRHGKKYKRMALVLQGMPGLNRWSIRQLQCLRHAVTGEAPNHEEAPEAWLERKLVEYQDDERVRHPRFVWYDLARHVIQLQPKLIGMFQAELPEFADGLQSVLLPRVTEVDMFGKHHMHLPFARPDGTGLVLRVSVDAVESEAERKSYTSSKVTEIATMKALKNAGLPVPEVFGDVLNEGHLFFAIEAMPGLAGPQDMTRRMIPSRKKLNDAQIANFIHDIATFYVGLSKLKFPFSGFLAADGSVGPFVRHRGNQMVGKRWSSWRERTQEEIDYRIKKATQARDVLVWLECESLLKDPSFDDLESDTHYILHFEDTGDQWLLDVNGHVQALLDWEYAYTTSKGEAFSGSQSCRGEDWYRFSNALSKWELMLIANYEKLDRPDLADCVRHGKKYQRFQQMLIYPLDDDTVGCINALRQAVTGEPFDPRQTWAQWVEAKMPIYADDKRLKRVLDPEFLEKKQKKREARAAAQATTETF